jgi:phosphotransferase system  glucose/maltose/N-acetylglucosamine-specific IIC component
MRDYKMSFIDIILNDPIAIHSMIGLGLVLGICAFYVYYFIANVTKNTTKYSPKSNSTTASTSYHY